MREKRNSLVISFGNPFSFETGKGILFEAFKESILKNKSREGEVLQISGKTINIIS